MEEGVVPGGGVAYLRCLKVLDTIQLEGEQALGINIIRRALEEPVRQIAANAGREGSVIVEHVKNLEGPMGFNASSEKYEDLIEAGVIDPAKVTRITSYNVCYTKLLRIAMDCTSCHGLLEDLALGLLKREQQMGKEKALAFMMRLAPRAVNSIRNNFV